MAFPASLPIEEALEYYERYEDSVVRDSLRPTYSGLAGYSDFVMGICPVREGGSFWLIGEDNKFWTNQRWHLRGEIAECRDYTKNYVAEWPLVNCAETDFSPLFSFIVQRGARWNEYDRALVLAEFGDLAIGLTDDMTAEERRYVRALMIYDFDQEWGTGAFTRSVMAGRIKHRRALVRARRRARATVGA